MALPAAMNTPQYADTYMPQPEDYETAEEYLAALKENAYDPASDPIDGRYWDPIGEVWRGGGHANKPGLTGHGQASLDALKLARAASANTPMTGGNLALSSRLGLMSQDAKENAYGAYTFDEDTGAAEALLSDPVRALMEKYGFAPSGAAGGGGGIGGAGGGSGGNLGSIGNHDNGAGEGPGRGWWNGDTGGAVPVGDAPPMIWDDNAGTWVPDTRADAPVGVGGPIPPLVGVSGGATGPAGGFGPFGAITDTTDRPMYPPAVTEMNAQWRKNRNWRMPNGYGY